MSFLKNKTLLQTCKSADLKTGTVMHTHYGLMWPNFIQIWGSQVMTCDGVIWNDSNDISKLVSLCNCHPYNRNHSTKEKSNVFSFCGNSKNFLGI